MVSPRVTSTTARRYQCNASNASGTTSLRGRVAVTPKETALVQQQVEQQYQSIHYQHRHSDSPMGTPVRQMPYVIQATRVDDVCRVPAVVRPSFVAGLHPQRVFEGTAARLQCTFQPPNDASTKVAWLFNGQPIGASESPRRLRFAGSRVAAESDLGQSVLEINPVATKDGGIYTCLVVNAAGEAQTNGELNVVCELTAILWRFSQRASLELLSTIVLTRVRRISLSSLNTPGSMSNLGRPPVVAVERNPQYS